MLYRTRARYWRKPWVHQLTPVALGEGLGSYPEDPADSVLCLRSVFGVGNWRHSLSGWNQRKELSKRTRWKKASFWEKLFRKPDSWESHGQAMRRICMLFHGALQFWKEPPRPGFLCEQLFCFALPGEHLDKKLSRENVPMLKIKPWKSHIYFHGPGRVVSMLLWPFVPCFQPRGLLQRDCHSLASVPWWLTMQWMVHFAQEIIAQPCSWSVKFSICMPTSISTVQPS